MDEHLAAKIAYLTCFPWEVFFALVPHGSLFRAAA